MTGKARSWTPELMRSLYVVDRETDCWLWIGGCYTNGYGRKRYKGKTVTATRFSWILHKGTDPGDEWVSHTCENRRLCVNPNHLVLGNPLKKLSTEQVIYVRSSTATGAALAKELNVSDSLISLIRANKIRKEAISV